MASKFIKGLFEKTTILDGDWLVMQPDAEESTAYRIKKSNTVQTLESGSAVTIVSNKIDLGGTATKATVITGTNSLNFFIGGSGTAADAFNQFQVFCKNLVKLGVDSNSAFIDLNPTGAAGGVPLARIFSTNVIKLQGNSKIEIDSPESEFIGQAHANTAADVIKSFTATPEFDFDKGNDHQMTLTGNVTAFTTTNEKGSAAYNVYLINDGTAGRTVAAPTGWTVDPTSETHTTAANAINRYQFYTLPDGSKYFNLHIVKA